MKPVVAKERIIVEEHQRQVERKKVLEEAKRKKEKLEVRLRAEEQARPKAKETLDRAEQEIKEAVRKRAEENAKKTEQEIQSLNINYGQKKYFDSSGFWSGTTGRSLIMRIKKKDLGKNCSDKIEMSFH